MATIIDGASQLRTMDTLLPDDLPLYLPRFGLNRLWDIGSPNPALMWLLPETGSHCNFLDLLAGPLRTYLGSRWHQVAAGAVSYLLSTSPTPSPNDNCQLWRWQRPKTPEMTSVWEEAERNVSGQLRGNFSNSSTIIGELLIPLPNKQCEVKFTCFVWPKNCQYTCVLVPHERQRSLFLEAFVEYISGSDYDILCRRPSQGRRGGRYVISTVEKESSDEQVLTKAAKIYGASEGQFRAWVARGKSITTAEANGRRFIAVEQRTFDDEIDNSNTRIPMWFSKMNGLALAPVSELAKRCRKSTDVVQDWIRKGLVYAELSGNEFLGSVTQADIENSKPRHPGGRPPKRPLNR